MGSVVMIFLPLLAPLILILGTAEKLGYDPTEVLLSPIAIPFEALINLIFGSTESFMSFLQEGYNNALGFLVENQDKFYAAYELITDFFGKTL